MFLITFDFVSTKTIEVFRERQGDKKMCISYGNSNEYYYIYWEKKLSQNVNHIEAHNKSLSHFQFVKFQQKTTYLKQLSIVCFCFKIFIFLQLLYT